MVIISAVVLIVIRGEDRFGNVVNAVNSTRPPSGDGGRKAYEDLVRNLFKDYDPIVPPNAADPKRPVDISLLMVIESLIHFDMRTQTLTVAVWFQVDWRDEAFSWDEDRFPADMIVVSEKRVWRPVLAIANTMLPRDQLMKMELPLQISSDGRFRWFPGDTLKLDCHVDLRLYPFDVQTCSVVVSQWSQQENLVNCTRAQVRANVRGNGEWDIVDVGVTRASVQELDYSYWTAVHTITLKRKWLFHVTNTIFPVVLVSALNCVVFLLPADCGEKMSVSVTAFLTLAVFMTLIQDGLPSNSDTVCYLAVYLATQMTLGGLAVVLTAVVVVCHRKDGEDGHGHGRCSSRSSRGSGSCCCPGVVSLTGQNGRLDQASATEDDTAEVVTSEDTNLPLPFLRTSGRGERSRLAYGRFIGLFFLGASSVTFCFCCSC